MSHVDDAFEAESLFRDALHTRDERERDDVADDGKLMPQRQRQFDLRQPKSGSGHTPRRARTNHLGVSINASGRSRIKYARTVTIVYESEQREAHSEAQRMALLREIGKLYDFSIEALHGIFKSFLAVARPGQSLIGPKTFRLVLARHNVRDAVIQQRLFFEFSDVRNPEKLEFRGFLRVLSRLADEPIEAKLELLFEVHHGCM